MAKQASRPATVPLTRAQELWPLACAVPALAPHAAHAPLWLGLAAGGMLAWRMLIWWWRWPLPPRWLLALLVFAGSLAVLASYRQFFGKDPGVALLILLLCLKLMELRGARDALVSLFLCYFLLLTHFFYAQGMESAGITLAALVLITAALAGLAHAGRKAVDHLRLAALMLAQALPFMLVLFLLFPRVQGPLWGLPLDAYSGMSGLADSMSPGSISELSLSGAIAFRVKFEGEPPPQNVLYWRGPVLTRYDGRTWRAVRQAGATSLPDAAGGSSAAYAVTLEPHNKPWLFALEMPVSLPPEGMLTSDYEVLSRNPVRTRLRYEMRSRPGLSPGAEETGEALRANLQLPIGFNPRARTLAAELRREAASDEAVARRLLARFRAEPFVYTLSPPLLGQDGIDEFLFETKRGFCEHYAAAFVFVMRAAGIPARVVTGYQGGERNPVDGYLVVRQSDAHAWAEVWLAGRGWVRVDPTAAIAPSRIERGLAAAVPAGEPLPFVVRADLGWLRELRFRWEALNNTWNQWVLGYNPQRQRELLSRLGLREPDWRNMTAALTALSGLLMLVFLAWALHRRIRLDPELRAWNRLSRRLGRIGLARHAWEGPADYARRVGQARPRLDADMRRIAALYIGLRYGRRKPDVGEARLHEMKRLIAGLGIA